MILRDPLESLGLCQRIHVASTDHTLPLMSEAASRLRNGMLEARPGADRRQTDEDDCLGGW